MSQNPKPQAQVDSLTTLALSFADCRQHSLALCAKLSPEDHMVQGAPFASPPKWHLAHTTWFFSTFILEPLARHPEVPESWKTLFNSYYNGVGKPHPRAERGIISRPALTEVLAWRAAVDEQILAIVSAGTLDKTALDLIELGIQHEMQHQELLLTDLLYSFSHNPAYPRYSATNPLAIPAVEAVGWHQLDGGLVDIGADAQGFSFDNEYPRHRQFLETFAIADRLITNGEFREFVAAGGYHDPQWWLSEGWDMAHDQQWQHPLYWLEDGQVFGLQGIQTLDLNAPVCHLSGYEADAYARWAGCRLPTEYEWEHAVCVLGASPPPPAGLSIQHSGPGWFGSVWQWTSSAYGPYPGFSPDTGAVGEYNGKFMSSQWVLRGASFATPQAQRRHSYRNFFYPRDRWQFTGLRLAKTVTLP